MLTASEARIGHLATVRRELNATTRSLSNWWNVPEQSPEALVVEEATTQRPAQLVGYTEDGREIRSWPATTPGCGDPTHMVPR